MHAAAMQPESVETVNPRRERNRRLGFALVWTGLGILLPALAVIAFAENLRRPAALVMLGSWVVWFVGKTLLKLNR